MADQGNAAIARGAYEAFTRGDLDHLASVFANTVWHVPGESRISGDKKGWADIGPFLGTLMEVSQGTFKAELQAVLASEDQVVTVHVTSGQRAGSAALHSLGVLLWRFENGQAVEIHEMFYDQYAEDEFWGK